MERFGTTDFDNNSRLITLSAILISGLHCITFSFVLALVVIFLLYISKHTFVFFPASEINKLN